MCAKIWNRVNLHCKFMVIKYEVDGVPKPTCHAGDRFCLGFKIPGFINYLKKRIAV
jgi:hypothetical protein